MRTAQYWSSGVRVSTGNRWGERLANHLFVVTSISVILPVDFFLMHTSVIPTSCFWCRVKGISTVLLGAIVRTSVGGSSVSVKGHYVNVVRLEGSISDATVTVEAG
ncbi:hypothetical protein BHM03_00010016 [Ensete ventricosum]|nr:hypothetical protein BHM03_00010016 [Ensete ventricosum]